MANREATIAKLIDAAYFAGIPIAYGFFGRWFTDTGMDAGMAWMLVSPVVAAFWPVSLLVWLGVWLA